MRDRDVHQTAKDHVMEQRMEIDAETKEDAAIVGAIFDKVAGEATESAAVKQTPDPPDDSRELNRKSKANKSHKCSK